MNRAPREHDRTGRRLVDRPNLGSALVDSYTQAVAQIADVAEDAAYAFLNYDSRLGAETTDDVVRGFPRAVSQTARAISEGLIAINEEITEVYAPGANRIRRSRGDRYCEGLSETEIVAEARRILLRGRYRGTTVLTLLREIRPVDGWSESELRGLIERNFVVEDDLVLPRRSDPVRAYSLVPEVVEDHLKALGYDDLRYDVRMERLDEDAPRARLVAYWNDRPEVLVHMVPRGRAQDVEVLDDARFAAKALSRDKAARYAYITDGMSNIYLDVIADKMVSAIPSANVSSSDASRE